MARVNVDDDLHRDPRFKDLCLVLQDEDKAIGAWVRMVRLATDWWIPNNKKIPKSEWLKFRLSQALITVGFVIENDENMVLVGCDDLFLYLEKRSEGGKASVEARKKRSSNKLKSKDILTPVNTTQHTLTPVNTTQHTLTPVNTTQHTLTPVNTTQHTSTLSTSYSSSVSKKENINININTKEKRQTDQDAEQKGNNKNIIFSEYKPKQSDSILGEEKKENKTPPPPSSPSGWSDAEIISWWNSKKSSCMPEVFEINQERRKRFEEFVKLYPDKAIWEEIMETKVKKLDWLQGKVPIGEEGKKQTYICTFDYFFSQKGFNKIRESAVTTTKQTLKERIEEVRLQYGDDTSGFGQWLESLERASRRD